MEKPAALGDGPDFGDEDLPEKIQKLGFGENIGRRIIAKGRSLKVAEVESLIGIHLANVVGQFRQGFEIVSIDKGFRIKAVNGFGVAPENGDRVSSKWIVHFFGCPAGQLFVFEGDGEFVGAESL